MKTKAIIFLIFLFPFILEAQTAQWILKPQYSSITPYGDKLLKVKLYNKVGLVSKDGQEIVPTNADTIMPITEGYGLVIKFEEDKLRLVGLVDQTPKMIAITQEMYVSEYPFFSEGKLPVYDKKGMFGFIDTTGELILDFNYSNIHPFSEGWAAVSKGTIVKRLEKMLKTNIVNKRPKMFYVNEHGHFMTLQSDIGDIYTATTFKNGEALVITKDNRNCIINTSGNIIRMANDIEMVFDEKYALISSEDEAIKENEVISTTFDGPITFIGKNNLYGYKLGDKVILPSQFNNAYSFNNGYAIASRNGYWGILKLINNDFQCKVTNKSIQNTNKEENTTNFTITIPEGWKGGKLLLFDLTDSKQKSYVGEKKDTSTYEFSVTHTKNNNSIYIGDESLYVWSNEKLDIKSETPKNESIAANKENLSVNFSAMTIKANEKDMASLYVLLSNKSSEQIELDIKISGDRLWGAEKTLKIKSGEKVSIPITFYKISLKEKRKINVKVSGIDNIISKKIEVNPFYEDF